VGNIGKVAVIVSANASELTKGLQTAEAALGTFAGRTLGIVGTAIPQGLRAGLGAVGDAVNRLTTDPAAYVGSLMRQVPKVGELLALPFDGISAALSTYKAGSDRVLELGMNAQKAGLGLNDFRAAEIAAGPAAESLPRALFKLNQHLADAVTGSQQARDSFRSFGLDAGKLDAMMPVDRLKLIADRFAAVQSPALRAQMAMGLFGKSGVELLPFLQKGAAGIAKAEGLMERLGLKVNPQDLANIKAVREAQKGIDLFKQAVGTQVTRGVGAVLSALVDGFGGVNVSAKGLAETIITVGEVIGYMGAAGLETFKALSLGVSFVARGFLGMASAAQTAFSSIIDMGKGVNDSIANDMIAAMGNDKLDKMAKEAGKTREQIIADLKKAMNSASGLGGASTVNDAIGDKIKAKIEGANKSITDQINGMGKSFGALGKLFEDARKKLAGGPLELKVVDPAEQLAAMLKRAVEIGNEVQTPFDKFADKQAELNKLVRAGAIDWDVYGKAAMKNLGSLGLGDFETPLEKMNTQVAQLGTLWDKGLINADHYHVALSRIYDQATKGLPEPKSPGALQANTKEAYSFVLNANRQEQRQDPQKQLVELAKESNAKQAADVENGKQILEAIRNIGVRGI
jgi:hypothetical protein